MSSPQVTPASPPPPLDSLSLESLAVELHQWLALTEVEGEPWGDRSPAPPAPSHVPQSVPPGSTSGDHTRGDQASGSVPGIPAALVPSPGDGGMGAMVSDRPAAGVPGTIALPGSVHRAGLTLPEARVRVLLGAAVGTLGRRVPWRQLQRGLWVSSWVLGGAVASLGAGIILAHHRPAIAPDPSQKPLVERAWQGWKGVGLVLGWGMPEGVIPGSGMPGEIQGEGAAPMPLSEDDRQRLREELAQLQQDREELLDRTLALEAAIAQLQYPPSAAKGENPAIAPALSPDPSLEGRLADLGEILNPPLQDAPNPSQAWDLGERMGGLGQSLRVTLPSDALFEDGAATLRSDASRLLAPVLADLRHYPGAQVTLATHTDDLGQPQQNQVLSLRQSQALAHYLQVRLGQPYRWNPLGYGESQPLTDNSTNSNRQRNRRVEVTIAYP